MPLSLSNGDFTPHIRWMASTSSWKISTDDEPETITWKHAIFDLASIETGWAVFEKGEPPAWILDPLLTQKAPRPDDGREWKRGFKLSVFSDSEFGGVREFATTATGAGMGIERLYEQFEAEAPNYPSKVPVVQFDGATPTKVGKGNTNIPNFKIVKWVDRPASLMSDQPPQPPKPLVSPQAAAGKTNEFGLPELNDNIDF